ncbi:MAG: sugar transferase [Planctomycetota bacterium]
MVTQNKSATTRAIAMRQTQSRSSVAAQLSASNATRAKHQVLLVGLNKRAARYLDGVRKHGRKSVEVVGALDAVPRTKRGRERNTGRFDALHLLSELQVAQLGAVADLRSALASFCIDEVLITLPIKSHYDEIAEVLAVCAEAGVPASLELEFFERDAVSAAVRVSNVAGRCLTYSCAQRTLCERALKRGIDIAGALFGLALFAAPMLVIALLIKLTSRGPVLFKQERSGRHNRRFKMLKFRTMVKNAEQLKQELERENEMTGPVFKMKRDPRVTKLGRVLRKFSLDELPQLINVLVGDMSLVGPRPPLPSEVAVYEWWQRRRLSTRPGLTCHWQVSGRNQVSFEDWMRLDLEYIDRWSLWLDVKLILKTIPAVLRARGAC